jgi:hypothetical protein
MPELYTQLRPNCGLKRFRDSGIITAVTILMGIDYNYLDSCFVLLLPVEGAISLSLPRLTGHAVAAGKSSKTKVNESDQR